MYLGNLDQDVKISTEKASNIFVSLELSGKKIF